MLNLTRNDVPEADGGHRDEAEVEGVEEGPVLEVGEDGAAEAEEDGQEAESDERHHDVGTDAHRLHRVFLLLFVVIVVVIGVAVGGGLALGLLMDKKS